MMIIRRTVLFAVVLLSALTVLAAPAFAAPKCGTAQGKHNPHCQAAVVSVTSAAFPSANRMVLTGTMLDTVTAIRPNRLGALFYNPAGVYGESNSPSVTINAWTATVIDVSYDGLSPSTAVDVDLYDSGFALILNYVV